MFSFSLSARLSLALTALLFGAASGFFLFKTAWILLLLAGVGFFVLGFLGQYFQFKKISFSCFLIAMFFLGLARSAYSIYIPSKADLSFYNNLEEQVRVIGVVSEEPDVREKSTRLDIVAEKIFLKNKEIKISGKLRVFVPSYPRFEYGDRLELIGQMKAPENFAVKFNYERYLARYKIFSLISYPQLELLGRDQGNLFFTYLFSFKNILLNKINNLFPEPEASFAAGLMLGARRSMPADVLAEFNEAGLTHILAISGYNIALVIAFVTGLLHSLGRKWRFPFVLIGVIIFVFLVGASAAVVRAAIMGLLAFFALTEGRSSTATVNLLLSGTLMVMVNPLILIADAGFQLSFLAVLGLIFVSPIFEKLLAKIPNVFAWREALVMTMAASVMTAPWIAVQFERFSVISPLANALAAFAIPLAMLFITGAVLIGFVSSSLALFFVFIANIFLDYILAIAHYTAALPYASITTQGLGAIFLVFYFLVLAGGIFLYSRKIAV